MASNSDSGSPASGAALAGGQSQSGSSHAPPESTLVHVPPPTLCQIEEAAVHGAHMFELLPAQVEPLGAAMPVIGVICDGKEIIDAHKPEEIAKYVLEMKHSDGTPIVTDSKEHLVDGSHRAHFQLEQAEKLAQHPDLLHHPSSNAPTTGGGDGPAAASAAIQHGEHDRTLAAPEHDPGHGAVSAAHDGGRVGGSADGGSAFEITPAINPKGANAGSGDHSSAATAFTHPSDPMTEHDAPNAAAAHDIGMSCHGDFSSADHSDHGI